MIDAAHDEWLTDGVMGRRVVAFLIDCLPVAALMAVLHLVLLAFGLLTLGLGLPLLGLLPLVPIAYGAGFVASPLGGTPGQLAMGLRVRRNADLADPSLLQAIVWAVGLALTLSAGIVWVLVALVTVRHRALHDIVSGLVVTRARAVAPRTGIWVAETPWRRPFA